MRKSIDLRQIGIFLLILPFLKPHSLEYLFPHLETLFDMGRLLCVVLIVLLWVSNQYRMSTPAAVFLFLEIWIVVVTLLRNPERLVASVINGAALSALVLAVDYFSQKEPKLLLRALLMNFEWLIWLNFLTVLLFRPEGMYSADEIHAYYFLGLPNSFMIFVMPACMAALMNLKNGMNRLRSIGLIAAGVLSVFITWSATAVVGICAMGAIYLLSCRKERPRLLSAFWLASLAADLAITVFQVTDNVPALRSAIRKYLHKSPTFSGRASIWKKAVEIIRAEPWLGHGFEKKIALTASADDLYSHAHNAYLQYWYIAGVLGIGLFLLLNILVIRRIRQAPPGAYKCAVIAPMAGLFIIFLTESCNYPALLMLYPLAANLAVLCPREPDRETEPPAWAAPHAPPEGEELTET